MNDFLATILIPTYNRSENLFFNVKYIKENADLSLIRLIVLDGSIDEIANANEKICEGSNIEYYHYGSEVTFQERVLNGIKKVKTEVMAILADDDRIDFNGFLECVYFLQSNEEYSCAHGQYETFHLKSGNIEKVSDIYMSPSYDEESPLVRLYNHLSHYVVHELFAVTRTNVMRASYQAMIDIGYLKDKYLCYELLHIAIVVVSGKIKRLPTPYYKRQIETSPSLLQMDNFNVATYLFQKNFSDMYQCVKLNILKYIDFNIYNKVMAEKSIDISFGAYYGSCLDLSMTNAYFEEMKWDGFVPKRKNLIIRIIKAIFIKFSKLF